MNQLQKGDCIAYDPNIFGETLTFDDLLKMVGQKVILETEWDNEMELEDISYAEVAEIVETNGIWIKYDNHSSEIQTMYREDMAHKCRQEYIRAWAIRDPAPETAVVVSEEYTKAVTLTRHIIANAQAMQQSLYEVCKGLKEMRDGKLYKELGYQNFEDYCKNEIGLTRQQGYTYLKIAENLPEDFVKSTLQIGVQKLALLAKLDEADREELTQRVNPEETSVKELQAQIKQLKEDKKQLQAEQGEISLRVGLAESQRDEAIKKLESKKAELANAQERIEELENQEPEAVYVEDLGLEQRYQEDVDRMDKEWARRYEEMEQEKDSQIIALKRQHYQKEQEFQQKLEEAQQSANCELDAYLKMFQDTLRHITALLGDPSMMGFAKRQAISQLEVTFENYIGAVKDD